METNLKLHLNLDKYKNKNTSKVLETRSVKLKVIAIEMWSCQLTNYNEADPTDVPSTSHYKRQLTSIKS